LPASLQQQEVYLHQASMEPNLWQPRVPFTAYEKMIFAGRRVNLHLILLFRALDRLNDLRTDKKSIPEMRDYRLLLDDLKSDGSYHTRSVVMDLRNIIHECFDELADSIRSNTCIDKEIDNDLNVDEIDDLTRLEMENLDTQPEANEHYCEWWIYPSLGTAAPASGEVSNNKRIRSAHPTGSYNFQSLANAAQAVMRRVYSEHPDDDSPLENIMKRNIHTTASLSQNKLKNTDLMTFHVVAMSLREFVQALLEFDRLCWGGDAGWMTAQFQ